MTATAKVVNTSHQVVLDGGGKVTLSGGGKIRILYMNTCDPKQTYITNDCWEQQWPQLVVQNLTFKDAYSAVRQTSTSSYGGGAIFDEGGQLKVVNSGVPRQPVLPVRPRPRRRGDPRLRHVHGQPRSTSPMTPSPATPAPTAPR